MAGDGDGVRYGVYVNNEAEKVGKKSFVRHSVRTPCRRWEALAPATTTTISWPTKRTTCLTARFVAAPQSVPVVTVRARRCTWSTCPAWRAWTCRSWTKAN